MTAPALHPLQAASLGEIAWTTPEGPSAAGVLPLVHEGRPVLALTMDRVALAVSLAAASAVDLVVREPRNTATGWRPVAWRCASRLVEDLDGEVFDGELLRQELRRYPPARRYADSPMLAREHWWYLPRLLVVLDPVTELAPPDPRSDHDDLLLVSAGDEGRPVTGGVRREHGRLRPTWGAEPAAGPAVVHDQDATFPDLERWSTWEVPARVVDGEVHPARALPGPAPLRMPRLAERWRAERRFAAACRRGLETWTR